MISIFRKNNYSVELNYTDESGNPKNIEGYTFNFIVKKVGDNFDNDTLSIINKSAVLSGTDAQNGIFYLTLSITDTDIEPNTYKCQFQLENTGIIETLLQDSFVIKNNYKKDYN